jgi:hydroxymethylbilane synthase
MAWRIHARSSDLARLQAYRVANALSDKSGESSVFSFRTSLGDQNLNDPLWKMPEKGVFTEDFVKDLENGEADFVVHSWKDLPTSERFNTEIVATLPRADVRDLLLIRKDRILNNDQLISEIKSLRILTSSPRRAYNLEGFLKAYLPFLVESVEFLNVRGNIPTRLKKLLSENVDGIIVAKAAIDRLLQAPEAEFQETQGVIRDVLSKTRFMVLPLTVNPTAAAQGALAIEISKNGEPARRALEKVQCHETFATVSKEREILASYGGGCHQKIGVTVLSRPYGEITFLRGLTDGGEVLNKFELKTSRLQTPQSIDPACLYPRKDEGATFFLRTSLERKTWLRAEQADFLWVARDAAWPSELVAQPQQIVWCAGLESWRKLAKRGVWVNGCAEGLGESEAPRLEWLVPQIASPVKLTHDRSADVAQSSYAVCATYALTPIANPPDLRGRTHFFWMSASGFDRALELFPEIRDKHHASGPGLTHQHLVRRLGNEANVSIYLNVEEFRRNLSADRE